MSCIDSMIGRRWAMMLLIALAPADGVAGQGRRTPSVIPGEFTVVGVGDLLYSEPLPPSADPELAKVAAIVRNSDLSLANQEVPLHDRATFAGASHGVGQLRGPVALAVNERMLGIDLVSLPNNHATDWGAEGLAATQAALDAAGIAHAGSGATLAAARRATIVVRPKGRVALVAAASTVRVDAMALDASEDAPARPGISVLRTRAVRIVTPAAMAGLRAAAGGSGEAAGDVVLDGQRYRAGATPGYRYEANGFDRAAILDAVRAGRRAADFAIFTIHAHENVDGLADERVTAPADFLPPLLRDAIDAGADMVVAGGPHSLRGIELHHGKPIFYGMGVFLIRADIVLDQAALTETYPSDVARPIQRTARPGGRNPSSWYDGVIARTTFRDGRLSRITLHPLDLGQTGGDARKGVPHLAAPTAARRILAELQAASAPFGTRIAVSGAVGTIDF